MTIFKTPFLLACSTGIKETVQGLLIKLIETMREEHEESPKIEDVITDCMHEIETGLEIASRHGHVEIVKDIFKQYQLYWMNKQYYSDTQILNKNGIIPRLFLLASQMGNEPIVSFLKKEIKFLLYQDYRSEFVNDGLLCYTALLYPHTKLVPIILRKIGKLQMLKAAFITAANQDDLQNVCSIYDEWTLLEPICEKRKVYLEQAFRTASYRGNKDIALQLIRYEPSLQSILIKKFDATFESLKSLLCCFQLCKHLRIDLKPVSEEMLKRHQSRFDILKQLVEWCDKDVREAFVPSIQFKVQTREHVDQIHAMERWFPRFQFKPDVETLYENRNALEVLEWKLNRLRDRLTISTMTSLLHMCVYTEDNIVVNMLFKHSPKLFSECIKSPSLHDKIVLSILGNFRVESIKINPAKPTMNLTFLHVTPVSTDEEDDGEEDEDE